MLEICIAIVRSGIRNNWFLSHFCTGTLTDTQTQCRAHIYLLFSYVPQMLNYAAKNKPTTIHFKPKIVTIYSRDQQNRKCFSTL